MSGPEVSTGVPLSAGAKGADPCEVPADPCVFFDSESDSNHSHVFDVSEPTQILAYDMSDYDRVVLEQVSGKNDGEFFEDVVVGGCTLELSACNNRILIPFKGRFRLRYEGDVGYATVVCEPSDCCFADIFPEVGMNNCHVPPALTGPDIASMLAFRTCDGGQVLPGEQLATCADLAALPSPAVYVDAEGNELPSGSVVTTPADIPDVPTYVDGNGSVLADGACVVSCAEFSAYVADAPNGLVLSGTELTLVSPTGDVSMVDLSGFVGGGSTDGAITNIELVGTDLVVTGSTGAFSGTVDLSSLVGSGGGTADGVVTNVALTGTDLVFTGSGGGFNGTVDLSALVGYGGGAGGDVTGVTASAPLSVTDSGGPVPNVELDITATAQLLCGDSEFIACVNALAQAVVDATITSAVDAAVTAALADCIKAGTFSVNFTSGGSSGSVAFDNAFPSGTTPVVVLQDYGNRDGGDSDDEEIWITAVTEAGFSWASRGDGPTTPFRYIAVEDKGDGSNTGGGTGGAGGGTGGGGTGGSGSGEPNPNAV